MNTSFLISANKIGELKSFISSDLPTARFNSNPYRLGDEFRISLNLEVEDANKLSKEQEKWYNQENILAPIKKINRRIVKSRG